MDYEDKTYWAPDLKNVFYFSVENNAHPTKMETFTVKNFIFVQPEEKYVN